MAFWWVVGTLQPLWPNNKNKNSEARVPTTNCLWYVRGSTKTKENNWGDWEKTGGKQWDGGELHEDILDDLTLITVHNFQKRKWTSKRLRFDRILLMVKKSKNTELGSGHEWWKTISMFQAERPSLFSCLRHLIPEGLHQQPKLICETCTARHGHGRIWTE